VRIGNTRKCRRGPMMRARLRDQQVAAGAERNSSRDMRLDILSFADKPITSYKTLATDSRSPALRYPLEFNRNSLLTMRLDSEIAIPATRGRPVPVAIGPLFLMRCTCFQQLKMKASDAGCAAWNFSLESVYVFALIFALHSLFHNPAGVRNLANIHTELPVSDGCSQRASRNEMRNPGEKEVHLNNYTDQHSPGCRDCVVRFAPI